MIKLIKFLNSVVGKQEALFYAFIHEMTRSIYVVA